MIQPNFNIERAAANLTAFFYFLQDLCNNPSTAYTIYADALYNFDDDPYELIKWQKLVDEMIGLIDRDGQSFIGLTATNVEDAENAMFTNKMPKIIPHSELFYKWVKVRADIVSVIEGAHIFDSEWPAFYIPIEAFDSQYDHIKEVLEKMTAVGYVPNN